MKGKIKWHIYEDIYVKNDCSIEELFDRYKSAFSKRDVSLEDLSDRAILFQWDAKRIYYKEMHQRPSLMDDVDRDIHTSTVNLNSMVTELIHEFIETNYAEGINSVDDLKKLTSALKDLQDSKLKLLTSLKATSTEAEDKRSAAKKLSPKELAEKVKALEKLIDK